MLPPINAIRLTDCLVRISSMSFVITTSEPSLYIPHLTYQYLLSSSSLPSLLLSLSTTPLLSIHFNKIFCLHVLSQLILVVTIPLTSNFVIHRRSKVFFDTFCVDVSHVRGGAAAVQAGKHHSSSVNIWLQHLLTSCNRSTSHQSFLSLKLSVCYAALHSLY